MTTQATQQTHRPSSGHTFDSKAEAINTLPEIVDCKNSFVAMRVAIIHKNAGIGGSDYHTPFVASNITMFSDRKSEEHEFGYAGSGPTQLALNLTVEGLLLLREAVSLQDKRPDLPQNDEHGVFSFLRKKLLCDTDKGFLSSLITLAELFATRVRDARIFEYPLRVQGECSIASADDVALIATPKRRVVFVVSRLLLELYDEHTKTAYKEVDKAIIAHSVFEFGKMVGDFTRETEYRTMI